MSGTATTVPNTTQQQQPQQTPVPVDVTQQQQQQQQPAATTTTATAAPTGLAAAAQSHILQHVNAQEQQQGLDYNSVLEQIQSLQKQNADLQTQLITSNQHLSKFREGKSAEMKELMETTIAKYLEQLNSLDQGSKENLKNNLEQLAKEGNATGVWEVMACASSNWAANVNQIETLTQQVNSYQVGGSGGGALRPRLMMIVHSDDLICALDNSLPKIIPGEGEAAEGGAFSQRVVSRHSQQRCPGHPRCGEEVH